MYEEFQTLPVTINKMTTRTISVSPKGVICEIKPVVIEDIETVTDSKEALKAEDALSRIKFPEALSDEDLSQCRELIEHYRDIFSTSDTDIGTTDKVKHHIELSDATPFK